MIRALMLAVGFLPGAVQAVLLGFIALCLIILVFKLVALVLDAIPFL